MPTVRNSPKSEATSPTNASKPISNSTVIGRDDVSSPEFSGISESSISPVKKEDVFDGLYFESCLSNSGTEKLFDERLDKTENRKSILVYLLQKIQDTEGIITKLTEDNKILAEKYTILEKKLECTQVTKGIAKKMTDESKILAEKCAILEKKFDVICAQNDEKNSMLHNVNSRTAQLNIMEADSKRIMEDLSRDNEKISFDLKRLQSEMLDLRDSQTIPDVSQPPVQTFSSQSTPSTRPPSGQLEQMNKYIKDVEVRVSQNQIHIEQIKDSNTTQLDIIKEVCGENRESIDWLQNELIRVDKDVTVTNQYNRRQNLIIDGIPNNVKDHQLQYYCIDVIRKLGFQSRTNPLTPYDVVGCHRLKKRPGQNCAPTIIRFTNRKVSEFSMKHRNRLNSIGMRHLSFREDLCPANEAIFAECEKLLEENLVSKVYTHNGFVKIVPMGTGRRVFPVKINHITDLDSMF